MKNKISLRAIRKSVQGDMCELSSLNMIIYLIMGVVPACIVLVYAYMYGSISSHWFHILTVGSIVSMTLLSKAALDLVHNRKRYLFSHVSSLFQASLVYALALGLCYGVVMFTFRDIIHVIDLFLGFNKYDKTEGGIFIFFFIALLYILMRLQFTSLYILEQRCNIVQAIHRSWLFTQRNIRLVKQFFLWDVVFPIVWILNMNFVFAVNWNIDFAIMFIGFIMVITTPMQIRMFKELEQQ